MTDWTAFLQPHHLIVFTRLQVECYDHDNDGSHDLIGTFETTMTRFQQASRTSPVWVCVCACVRLHCLDVTTNISSIILTVSSSLRQLILLLFCGVVITLGFDDGQNILVIVNWFSNALLSLLLSSSTDTDTHAVLFCPQAEFECVNSKKKQKKKGYKNSGIVSVKLCQVECCVLGFSYLERVHFCD